MMRRISSSRANGDLSILWGDSKTIYVSSWTLLMRDFEALAVVIDQLSLYNIDSAGSTSPR